MFFSNRTISDMNIDFYAGHLKWAIRFFIVFYYINWRYHLPWSDMFRLSSFPYFILIPIIVISIGNNFFCEEISNYFEEIKRIIHYSNPAKSTEQFIMPNIGYEYFYELSFFLVIGPILEEVLFRGIILEGLLSRYKPARAILYSSLLFGLMHIDIFRIFHTFLAGLIFSYLYYKTRSLIPCIFAHSLWNILITVRILLLLKIPGTRDYAIKISQSPPLWYTFSGVALFLGGLLILVIFFNRQGNSIIKAKDGDVRDNSKRAGQNWREIEGEAEENK